MILGIQQKQKKAKEITITQMTLNPMAGVQEAARPK